MVINNYRTKMKINQLNGASGRPTSNLVDKHIKINYATCLLIRQLVYFILGGYYNRVTWH